MARKRTSEVDAYVFIKENLGTLGWDTRNPARNPKGQVYTQNECLSHPEIQKFLGQTRPENIVKITETIYWIIEAKSKHDQLEQALKEARKDYADKINESKNIKAKFITGIAGNRDDSYLIKTRFLKNGIWVPIKINEREISGFLFPEQIRSILDTNNPNIADVQIDKKLFISKAEEVNEILHLGAVNPHQRAGVMSALLISMLDDTQPNIDAAPSVLINEINARVQRILRNQGKSEFYDYIKLSLPATEDNHHKFKSAVVETLQELNNLNIRSAMNSGVDVLGEFYEVFLKYANWAQDLGIVLTPRHITRFAADVMNIQLYDVIYDPCCGTGGFLVAAFDYVKRNSNAKQLSKFKQNNVFGVEQDSGIASLAIVNMIFRGDGKNNIIEGNCFSKFLEPSIRNGDKTSKFSNQQYETPPVTKVLMNPPFALKRSDEKEYKFVEQALKQMEEGGLLFSVLPYSCMIKRGKYLTWRKNLLDKNTLLSVVTFPDDLFYPIGVHTLGIFVKKGVRHPLEQNVLWVRALSDGFVKSKGKRLPSNRVCNDLEKVKNTIKAFLANTRFNVENIQEFQKSTNIDFSDPDLELVPEVYLDEKPISPREMSERIEQSIRDNIAFHIKFEKQLGE